VYLVTEGRGGKHGYKIVLLKCKGISCISCFVRCLNVLFENCRYVIVINGRKAIHEALVINSIDFADRPQFYSHTLVNKHLKGNIMTNCKILAVD